MQGQPPMVQGTDHHTDPANHQYATSADLHVYYVIMCVPFCKVTFRPCASSFCKSECLYFDRYNSIPVSLR